jgi:hypothetical protein
MCVCACVLAEAIHVQYTGKMYRSKATVCVCVCVLAEDVHVHVHYTGKMYMHMYGNKATLWLLVLHFATIGLETLQ